MSFSHWLKGATRVRLDSRTAGNLLKNGAVVGGTIAGGPLGLAIGGLGGVVGQAALGGNLRESLNAGLKGAANTGLAQAGKGIISHALSSGAPGVPATTAGAATPDAAGFTPLPNSTIPTGAAIPGGSFDAGRGFLKSALDTGKGAASFLGDHDKIAGALLTTGADAFDSSDRRLRSAEAAQLEQKNLESDYDYNKRKAQDLALEPLRKALYGSLGSQIGGNYGNVAPNPYAPVTP